MTGFSSMYIAIKPNNTGNIALAAVMGPDTKPFANLTPVSSGDNFTRGLLVGTRDDWGDIMTTSGVGVEQNAWNIIYADLFTGQKICSGR